MTREIDKEDIIIDGQVSNKTKSQRPVDEFSLSILEEEFKNVNDHSITTKRSTPYNDSKNTTFHSIIMYSNVQPKVELCNPSRKSK